jgi:hypothetical protein
VKLLGHEDVRTTMIDTHVLNGARRRVRGPLDQPAISVVTERATHYLATVTPP